MCIIILKWETNPTTGGMCWHCGLRGKNTVPFQSNCVLNSSWRRTTNLKKILIVPQIFKCICDCRRSHPRGNMLTQWLARFLKPRSIPEQLLSASMFLILSYFSFWLLFLDKFVLWRLCSQSGLRSLKTQTNFGAAAFIIHHGTASKTENTADCTSSFQILVVVETNLSTEKYVDVCGQPGTKNPDPI